MRRQPAGRRRRRHHAGREQHDHHTRDDERSIDVARAARPGCARAPGRRRPARRDRSRSLGRAPPTRPARAACPPPRADLWRAEVLSLALHGQHHQVAALGDHAREHDPPMRPDRGGTTTSTTPYRRPSRSVVGPSGTRNEAQVVAANERTCSGRRGRSGCRRRERRRFGEVRRHRRPARRRDRRRREYGVEGGRRVAIEGRAGGHLQSGDRRDRAGTGRTACARGR